jgi:DNA invertase Pin-like site-specific DNA recombinase
MLAESPKFIGYVRVSGKSQVDGDGPARQEDSIRAFAKANGLTVLCIESEDGVSGTIEGMDRPVFSKVIAMIEDDRAKGIRVDGIIVERMDRLARDLMVSEMLLKECRERSIKVLCADQGLDNVAETEQDPTRTLIRQVLGALAQWEKSALVMKLRKSRERVRAKTGRCEGQKPMGTYRHEPAVMDYVLNTAATSTLIFPERMANELNETGLRNRKGGLWTKESVTYLLRKFAKWKGNPPLDYNALIG